MAGKPNLTLREKKVYNELASEEYIIAIDNLEAMKETISVIQDGLFYKSLGVKVDNVQLRQEFKQLESFMSEAGLGSISEAISARNSTRSKKRVTIKR